jgi:class 3 adenylate cyclase
MLSSKDILERTGIARATLNNYIAAGLVVRPDVLPPEPQDGGAPRIGYFPDDTVEKIETIQRLKREGWSLGRILEFFASGAIEPIPGRSLVTPQPSAASEPDSSVQVSVQSTVHASVQSALDLPPDSLNLLVVAVLAVTLHDAEGLWVNLSVQDYFDVVNEFSAEMRRVVQDRHGRAVRLAPHRFICHFLPKAGTDHLWSALEAGHVVRETIREVSARWKLRRGWNLNICADAGVAEGEAWVSTDAARDLQVVGDAAGDALQLARWSRCDTVLVTRNLIARLPASSRARVVYAAPAPGQVGGAPQHPNAFIRLQDIAPSHGLTRRLANLPVTELLELRTGATEQSKDSA